ncbi:MAG: polyhydroxyalkanoic acid system family protein [Gammaproteobacteria bacterium]|jgi:putative polyhydroxyalkanoate system protein
MATIHIKKAHAVDHETVKQEVQNLADKLSKELSADYQWEGDRLVFKRKGASGHIDISETEVDIEIKLGMVLTPLKGAIEKTVTSYLDEHLG